MSVELATNTDIQVIIFGGFRRSQGSASSLQFDIGRFSCSDSNSPKPASEEHARHCRVKLLHLQVGSLSIEADELFPVRQELSLPLHSELGPDLSHVFKVDIHKADSLQLLLEGKSNHIAKKNP